MKQNKRLDEFWILSFIKVTSLSKEEALCVVAKKNRTGNRSCAAL